VVLVAAKKDYVNEYTSVVIEAGLEPTVCDIDAFAVQNMFEANYERIPDQTYALVNIGAAKTNINIVARGISSFTRDLAVGGNTFTEEIQKQLSVTRDEAEALKLGSSGAPDSNPTGLDTAVPQDVEQAMHSVAESVTTEIQRSIDFYVATSADPAPAAIYVSGGTARLATLTRALQARMGVEVVVVDPFRQLIVADGDREYVRTIGPAAGVAVGLAGTPGAVYSLADSLGLLGGEQPDGRAPGSAAGDVVVRVGGRRTLVLRRRAGHGLEVIADTTDSVHGVSR
jgi:type IV pilus assembly protein PilM